MGAAAQTLESFGYRYLAIGGLVPLRPSAIHECLSEIRRQIRPTTKLHLLGFAKAEQIHEFVSYGIESFDSTSPLIRAFKDAKANYYLPGADGKLRYYAAIRIPQAIENPRLMQAAKTGRYRAEDLLKKEADALNAIRSYDRGTTSLASAIEILFDYQSLLIREDDEQKRARELDSIRNSLHATLRDAPWKQCNCEICRDAGVEVIIFRASNRNKRRGFHNLGVFYRHLQKTIQIQ
jgi:queuine/archaeosine tRNA-ribosyltransferase